eukprot:7387799-Prymnesium_polylepis.1
MSEREVFGGNHERTGAHVIENAKLVQPPPARAGPSRTRPCAHLPTRGHVPACPDGAPRLHACPVVSS